MLNQEKIGTFIAALRKEKKLTQEQLAERLGVNNRSVSRWENGHCMPDLSLLQSISEELEVSISELLNGERIPDEAGLVSGNSTRLVIELSNKAKNQKTQTLNRCFIAGSLCFLLVILDSQFNILSFIFQKQVDDFVAGALTGFGLLFEFMGFYQNNHDQTLTQRKVELLSRHRKTIRMMTASEMLQFAERYQNSDKKQYLAAFAAIEKELEANEKVLFSAIGNSYFQNERPVMWHTALAVTSSRLLIGGESVKGMVFTQNTTQSFPLTEIQSVQKIADALCFVLVIQTPTDELKLEVENSSNTTRMISELQKVIWELKK